MTISFIRNTTGILDQETLEGISQRYKECCAAHSMNETDEESWKTFWRPVGYIDFMSIMGQKVEYEGEVCELSHPYYLDFDNKVDKMFGPEHASVKDTSRFDGWAPPKDIPYPVDTDIKIRIALKGKENHKHVLMSYNEIAGLSGGRYPHWSEGFTFKDDSPQNGYLASLNNDWLSDPLYRTTPEGEPTVADLIKKGSIVQSNYSDTVYIVSNVKKYEYRPKERPEDHGVFEEYSLSLIDRRTGKGGFTINELVAVGGKVLKLFMANEDEVFVLGNAESIPTPIMEDDEEDEFCESCAVNYEEEEVKTSEPTKQNKEPLTIKGVQLSLF